MNHDAIFNVTQSLRDLLQSAIATAQLPGTAFVGPLDDPDAGNATLILFLYKVTPNADLRNHERQVTRNDGQGVNRFENSLPLDLCYLLTVGTMDGTSEETPLRALGAAMQTLQRNSIITSLSLDQETIRISLDSLSTDEMSRVWALFPNANYRTSVAYHVSPVWIDPREPEGSAEPVLLGTLKSGVKSEGTIP